MRKMFAELSRLMVTLAMFFSVLMALIITGSVISRYVFSSPLQGTDEVIGMLFTSMVFLALPHMFLTSKNIEITIFSPGWSGCQRVVLRTVGHVLCILFLAVFAKLTLTYTIDSYTFAAKTMVAEIPIWPCAALAFGSCLLAILASAFNVVKEVMDYLNKDKTGSAS